jgi:hypothetical protein
MGRIWQFTGSASRVLVSRSEHAVIPGLGGIIRNRGTAALVMAGLVLAIPMREGSALHIIETTGTRPVMTALEQH